MYDVIEKLDNSLIQHGKFNNRIYLMKLNKTDFPEIVEKLEKRASQRNYTKIFAKVPEGLKEKFIKHGYREEAAVPNFYQGETDAFFLAKYFSDKRKQTEDGDLIKKIIKTAREKRENGNGIKLPESYAFRICGKEDVADMAEVYRIVFKTYPFPIHEPEYLSKTMDENIVYFSIWEGNKLVALSSSEMDGKAGNVEMTDFATLPEYRGNGFAVFLLDKMEKEMKKRGIQTAYTIARAVSFGMNITFARMGYHYSGTLINNTNISGSLESMNVWYKFLIQ